MATYDLNCISMTGSIDKTVTPEIKSYQGKDFLQFFLYNKRNEKSENRIQCTIFGTERAAKAAELLKPQTRIAITGELVIMANGRPEIRVSTFHMLM